MGRSTISEDIIVQRRVIREYVRNLDALLRNSRGKNVVLKTAKCEFNKERVVYCGLTFSKDGASPDFSKVQAIWTAGQLKECNRT